MNRRQAIKTLVALPAVTRIATAAVAPADVLVVECEGYISADQVRRIYDQLNQIWPGRKIVVLDGSMRIRLMSGGS